MAGRVIVGDGLDGRDKKTLDTCLHQQFCAVDCECVVEDLVTGPRGNTKWGVCLYEDFARIDLFGVEGLDGDAGYGRGVEESVVYRGCSTVPKYILRVRGCNMSEIRDSYIGSREGWTFIPPYLTALMMRSGIKRPKEAATRRFISPLEEASGSS